MASKAAVKSARACLESHDFEGAKSYCLKALEQTPQNYPANLYLGLALFKLGSLDDSEQAYKRALKVEQKYERQPEPWKGLLDVYAANRKINEYIDTAVRLATIYRDIDDRIKCTSVIDLMVPFVEKNGSSDQYKRALRYLLPESPLFEYLEGRIPHPADTFIKLVEITEAEEKEKINNEIAKRRSRLGATLKSVTAEVKKEVLGASLLEGLYLNVLDWSDNEELRRSIESRMVEHGYRKLVVLPIDQKQEQREKVLKWAEGIVILKYPFELAWKITLEWNDHYDLVAYDVNVLQEFIDFFPTSGLGTMLKAFLESEISPFPVSSSDQDPKKDGDVEEDTIRGPAEGFARMVDGLEKDPKSILCHRFLGSYYLHLSEFESAVTTCRAGRSLVISVAEDVGTPLQGHLDALTATLATALIHYQSPKHHSEAKGLFQDLLKRDSSNTSALIGLGMILEEQENFEGAAKLLDKALELNPDKTEILSEASWCRVLMGHYEKGRQGLERCLELIKGVDANSRELKAQVLWRIGSCIWHEDEESRSDRNGAYSYFMAALRSNGNFAPAYTSMGIFYQDIAQDTARATKCFERAFELSAGEVEAAERLAHSFAESREWDLVDIVARRVVDTNKKRSIPGKSMSWPQRAIGVVELNEHNYVKAIQAFQAALRTTPTDFHSWVGLGEAYASSGRYIAALKAFAEAEKLDSTDWFAKYMIANVHRELNEFDEACTGYRAVLEMRPREFGVLIALTECLGASAYDCAEKGYYGQAVETALESLQIAFQAVRGRSDSFNLWKVVGDMCLLFSLLQALAARFPTNIVQEILTFEIGNEKLDILSDCDGVTLEILESLLEKGSETACLHMALLACKRALYASAEDRHAHAVAWFNLGCAEYRSYIAVSPRQTKYRNAAIRCFKRAIKVEPGNYEFWNALGVVTSEVNARAAQHAFIRSLYINNKNARVWTNLGTLYLLLKDLELAGEAFSRAQAADPDYGYAWAGQGYVAAAVGEAQTAYTLFEHAIEASDGFSALVRKEYAISTFDMLAEPQVPVSSSSLLASIFGLHKLEMQHPNDATALHLSALFQERIGNFENALRALSRVCEVVEQRYEVTEEEEDLIKYARAKADLARAQLGIKSFAEAVENAAMALDLSTDLDQLKPCRLSAHLTAGLGNYYLGQIDESLSMFKAALQESDENPDVVLLLAQVLWAKGGEDEREVAREQLFTCIEKHPDHLSSMLLLGSLGALDNNPDILDAVMDDLKSVRGNGLSENTPDKIDHLLVSIPQLMGNNPTSVASSVVFLRPTHPKSWSILAKVSNNQHAAEMAARIALHGSFAAEIVADAYADVGQISNDQRAIMLAPWGLSGWRGLGLDVANAAAGA